MGFLNLSLNFHHLYSFLPFVFISPLSLPSLILSLRLFLLNIPPYFQETPAFAEIGTNLDLKKNQPSISEKVFSDSEYIIFLYPT